MAGTKKNCVEKAVALLSAQVQQSPEDRNEDRVVRRYELGHKPKIKNYVNGRSTNRPDLIFEGELEVLLPAPGIGAA